MDALIANYAYDDTDFNKNADLVVLKGVAVTTTRWFLDNDMSANSDKFQCMPLGHSGPVCCFRVRVSGHHIETLECIKILGITFDNELNSAPIQVTCATRPPDKSILYRGYPNFSMRGGDY